MLLSTVRIVTDNGQNGTGFAIDGGYIVTNYHVVWDSEDSITAATSDGTEHPAAIIGFDGMTDIAVLEIPVILEPLELGNSEAVLAGDPVYRLITSEDWSLYIQLTAKQIVKLNTTSNIRVRFLKDDDIYLGNQVERADSDRCYGVVANEDFILVCEYGCNGSDPEIVLYTRR